MNRFIIVTLIAGTIVAFAAAAPEVALASFTQIESEAENSAALNPFEFFANSARACRGYECSPPCYVPGYGCCPETGFPQCCRINGVCGCCRS